MSINELIKEISNKQFSRIYIFTGDDWKLMQLYVEKICNESGSKKTYCENIYDVLNALTGKSLLTKTSCFVLRDDKDMLDETKFNKVKTMLDNNILILIYTSIDKRNKFYKQNKDNIVEFEHLDDSTLLSYCANEIDLNNANLKRLIALCENDLGRLLLEINKIKSFSNNSDEGFEMLMNKNLIYQPPKDAVFDLVDAVLRYDASKSYRLLQDCKDIGEANLVILTNLFTSAKQVLQVQSYDGSDVQKATGLSAWQIRKAQEKANVYSNRELINIMKLVQRVEESIKIGKIEDEVSVDYVLEEIFNEQSIV